MAVGFSVLVGTLGHVLLHEDVEEAEDGAGDRLGFLKTQGEGRGRAVRAPSLLYLWRSQTRTLQLITCLISPSSPT